MKELLIPILQSAVDAVMTEYGQPDQARDRPVQVERTRNSTFGDVSSNCALIIAPVVGAKPRDLAAKIVSRIPSEGLIERVEIAGPGFINFWLRKSAYTDIVTQILATGAAFGRCDQGGGRPLLLEFVSANPTGPLHIGHGRGAAYGATLAKLLETAGWKVSLEYYVNDAGRQMDILALSVWLRYLQRCGESFEFPDGAYRGDYLLPIAGRLHAAQARALHVPATELALESGTADDTDARLDRLVARARTLLGAQRFEIAFRAALDDILADIRDDLAGFGVRFDRWYSERELKATGYVEQCIARLQASGHLYQQDGALWFRSSAFGDEKDRVVIRENGQQTYFAADLAYHLQKFERGFERAIDIWGADHHGYEARMKAVLQALGRDPQCLEILFVQFATLYRGSERVQMSTRAGEFITLRELRNEVGNDAARFFYASRKSEQHLEFDLELAKSQSSDNPVYYVQYAHARIASVLREAGERNLTCPERPAPDELAWLTADAELRLLNTLSRWPELVREAARRCEPHQVSYYLRELANDFHSYYNSHQFLVDEAALRNARIALIRATRQVLQNGLGILGVSAPEEM
jgi:arginyl-tRNA synthetase